mmetsp:Transcript_45460/g.144607  ORF Transcript_45460/g.144607 Transcript_45460/m.144607 type:complete len:280 (+) Transcript_45460:469-1308(+)
MQRAPGEPRARARGLDHRVRQRRQGNRVHADQARGRRGGRGARAHHALRGAPRRYCADDPREDPQEVPRGQLQRARGHGRRGPRPRHPQRRSRCALRDAQRLRDLPPPLRAYRPRQQDGHRHRDVRPPRPLHPPQHRPRHVGELRGRVASPPHGGDEGLRRPGGEQPQRRAPRPPQVLQPRRQHAHRLDGRGGCPRLCPGRHVRLPPTPSQALHAQLRGGLPDHARTEGRRQGGGHPLHEPAPRPHGAARQARARGGRQGGQDCAHRGARQRGRRGRCV